jgi:tRNA A22 N-methylase
MSSDDIIILSPHNNLEEVREYLDKSVYGLEEEFLITDNNKFYEVLVLSKSTGSVPLVGEFVKSELETLKSYFIKSLEYFTIKSNFNKEEKFLLLKNMYKSRLDDLEKRTK